MQLTLLIPELIWPEPEDHATLDGLDCPQLATLLARSRMTRRPAQALEASLCELFGYSPGVSCAAFRLLGETASQLQASEFNGLCCDPVHLRFHQERLVLADSRKLGLHSEEAAALADELNAQLSTSGRFHVLDAERWYLQLNDTQLLAGFDMPPLSAVAGRSIDHILAESTQSPDLRRLFNEIQMLLHAHPINLQREDDGRMSINSLWLWGGGSLPPRVDCAFSGVWSDNPLAQGLARAAGLTAQPAPTEAASFFTQAASAGQHLLVIEDLLGPVQYENGEAYRAVMSDLEQRWFAPLRQALAAGRISRLRIEAPTAYATLRWEGQRSDLWKFWLRPQPLQQLAQELQ